MAGMVNTFDPWGSYMCPGGDPMYAERVSKVERIHRILTINVIEIEVEKLMKTGD